MKKIGLICATLIVSLSLAGCNNSTAQGHKKDAESSSASKTHHARKQSSNSKDQENDDSLFDIYDSDSQENTSSASDAPSDNSSMNIQQPQASSNNSSTTTGGDPKAQSETAQLQHEWNVKQGIENPDGSETQNFQNWVSARDNAWNNGNDNFPSYDQNQQW